MACAGAHGACGGNPVSYSVSNANSYAVVSDGTNIYWSDEGLGGIVRCSVHGCGGSPTLVVAQNGPFQFAVDGKYIYWNGTGNQILRLPK
jgi:hypothetical protein